MTTRRQCFLDPMWQLHISWQQAPVPVCSQDKPNVSTERDVSMEFYLLADKPFGIDAYESGRVMDSSGSSCT